VTARNGSRPIYGGKVWRHKGVDELKRNSFLVWASNSLTGHVAFFNLIFGLPMDVLFIYLNYTQGTLTPTWALWIVALGIAGSILVAILVWTTITLPRLRVRK
jgi:hypothetical protein